MIPSHQFGFRDQHSTIEQVHRITDIIEEALENKMICSSIFLDVSQAFDKVWHEGLLYKLKTLFPREYTTILESYLTDRYFRVKQEDAYSVLKAIKAGVPQGSILGPTMYILFTNDMPTFSNCTLATFADDTAILSVGKNEVESTQILQNAVDAVLNWTKKWGLKLNSIKSIHVNYTNKKIQHIPIIVDGIQVPYSNTAKYLGMNLDAKLRWKEHIKKKREELNIKLRTLDWLIGRRSVLSIHNKLLIYKQILKPVWTYGIQLWGCAAKNNIEIIQRFQNKALRCVVNAPWYVRNSDLHRDLKIKTVEETIREHATAHHSRLRRHINQEAAKLCDTTGITRRLKRIKPHELTGNNVI